LAQTICSLITSKFHQTKSADCARLAEPIFALRADSDHIKYKTQG